MTEQPDTPVIASLHNVVKRYAGLPAVDALNIEIREGEILGLLGPSASGKTTAIALLAGLVPPDRGRITLFGTDVSALAPKSRGVGSLLHRIGVVPQEPALFDDLTVGEHLRFFGELFGLRNPVLEQLCGSVLELMHLTERRDTRAGRLNSGMRRRLNMACALVHRPQILILDEPTVGIDPGSRRQILDSVRTLNARGTTVLYASHHMSEVEAICTRIAIMDHGRILVSGTVPELIERLGADDRIRVRIDRTVPDLRARLSELAGVHHCSEEPDSLVIIAEHGQVRLARVVEAVARCGAEVIQADLVRPTLDDLFLSLTGRTLRG